MSFLLSNDNMIGIQEAKNLLNRDPKLAEGAEPLEFKTLQLRYNFFPGSKSSINFHDSLTKVEGLNAFRSEAL